MARLEELAAAYIEDFVNALTDHHPSDGHDDMAILALLPPHD